MDFFFYFKDKLIRHIFTYFQADPIINYLLMLNYVTLGVTLGLIGCKMTKL